MRHLKHFILYLVICVLGLGIIAIGTMFIAGYSASKDALSSLMKLKEQNVNLQAGLNKAEEAFLRLENENKQLKTKIVTLDEFQTLERELSANKNQKAAVEVRGHLEEYNALKEEYGLLQEAYNELLREKLIDSEPAQQRRGGELTAEQMENFMVSARERTYSMMDNRIAQAKTDYEAGILTEIKNISINLFDLQDKMRTVSEEERETIRQSIAEERRTLGKLYGEYNSYQWKTLAEQFKVKNIEEFTRQAQELMQNRQSPWFGREMPQRRSLSEEPIR